MFRKLSFLLLGAFLLAHWCQARPSQSSDSNESDESDIPERLKLEGMNIFANHTVAAGKILFKNTVHELTALNEKSKTTEEHITKLKHYVEEVEKFESSNDDPTVLFQLLVKLADFMNEIHEEPTKSEDVVYINALKKQGLDKFDTERDNDFWGS